MRIPFIDYNTIENKTFTEAHISDIHFGVIDPKVQYQILESQFINKIKDLRLDIISINGDLFHHKFMANSEAVLYASKFISTLVSYCKNNGTTLILIHGTNDHDASQLKLFYHLANDKDVDIRIVENVQFEYVKGKKILCIPELYGKNKEFYEHFLYDSGFYDAVYMHGTYKDTIYGKNEAMLDSLREPVFDMPHFVNCKGPIISGHNHIPGCYNSHFYYCGSPLRWQYGEEQDKGFIILLHNIETMQYYTHFEKIESFLYNTYNLDSLILGDPKEIIEFVKQRQLDGVHFVRIAFTIDNDENIKIINNFYKTQPNVKIMYNVKQEKIRKEAENSYEKYKEYEYIFDKSLKPEDVMVRYINQNKGYVYLTSEDLLDILRST